MMDESSNSSPSSLASSNEENTAPDPVQRQSSQSKICEVCGDKAKSYHFGGLCCESCKAFFRRAMQNDSYKSFFCVHGQSCQITKENRRGCQYCRIQKCFSIGMEKGWLRTEEECQRLRELKLVNSRAKQAALKAELSKTNVSSPQEQTQPQAQAQAQAQAPDAPYQPRFEEIGIYLSETDVRFIESIVDSYWKAYKQVPFGPEVTQNTTPRTGLQVISMFTTGIRRWATFSRSLSEFNSLCREDQATILKAAIMQLSILRAVASFRMDEKEWRVGTPVDEFTPSLTLQDVQRLLTPQLAEMHLTFISSMRKLQVDEPTIMLLSLITLFTADRGDLIDRERIAKTQDDYVCMLKRYCTWKYGPSDRNRTFANLLAKMSDLRELSDVHSDHQVRFANQDLHKLYQEIDTEPRPNVNSDLNNTSHFLKAMEFSIEKTHHTLPKPPPVADPTYQNLEQIEQMCANIEDKERSPMQIDDMDASNDATGDSMM